MPPELDTERVTMSDGVDSDGARQNYIKTTGLDAYLWQGATWDRYDGDERDAQFDGWKQALSEAGLAWSDLLHATPHADLKARWLAGRVDWEEVIEAYLRNFQERTGLRVELEDSDGGSE